MEGEFNFLVFLPEARAREPRRRTGTATRTGEVQDYVYGSNA